MSGNSGVMMYFDSMAKLTANMSKETKFFFHMLRLMEYHKESKMNIVNLSTHKRREIIKIITPESKDPLSLARQYLSRLNQQNRIKSIGGGAYLIDPRLFGYASYIGLGLRMRSGNVYENRVFFDDGSSTVEAYILDPDTGERIDLT